MNPRAFPCALGLSLLTTVTSAVAQITVPSGFSVTVYQFGLQVTGIDIAPPGPYGEQLFISVSGAIYVVDPLTGTATLFASGLSTGIDAPSGIEFDEGTFGTGLLYVAQNGGDVVTVDPLGTIGPFASGGGLFSCNDLTFAEAGSPFGATCFVSNGMFFGGSVSAVDANGVVTAFASGAPISTALGLAIPPPGSAFGSFVYVADTTAGAIHRIDAAGVVTTFVSGLAGPADIAFSRGGLFGDLLYVSDLNNDTVSTVDAAGNVTPFASGFLIANNGWNGDILFDFAGDALYVANNSQLVRISDEPDIPFCYGNGASVPCPCGNTAPLLARSGCLHSGGVGGRLDTLGTNSVANDNLAFVASQLPPNQFCIMFAGDGLVPEVPIGDGLRCVGGNLVRLDIRATGSAGVATWGPSLNADLGWSAGDVLRFQVWYRNPVGSPCGTGFNVTNASQVTATP